MNLARILLADEGVIGRREWWAGTALLIGVQLLAGWVVSRHIGHRGHAQAIMLFVSIAMLIPFHSLNAKRFRAIGQPAGLAFAGGGIGMAAILCGAFLPGHAVNIPLGLALLAVIVWFAAALGFYDPPPRIDPDARRA
jgi:uncharacterized membrane protein YhaH (DUF805 family)